MSSWTLYYEPPETRNWRVTGKDIDGKQQIRVEVEMDCLNLRHAKTLNTCRFCGERHELPKETDQRYAYKWYPQKPSLKAIVQWDRRNRERIIASEITEASSNPTTPGNTTAPLPSKEDESA